MRLYQHRVTRMRFAYSPYGEPEPYRLLLSGAVELAKRTRAEGPAVRSTRYVVRFAWLIDTLRVVG